MSNAKPNLTESENRLLGQAWQCFKEEKSLNSNIDFEKLATLAGHTNYKSTKNAINAIMKKLRAGGGGDPEGASSPATPTSPKPKLTKTGKAVTATAGNKRKKGADAVSEDDREGFIKTEDHDDDGAPVAASPPKAKRARKTASSNANGDANMMADEATAASKPPGPTARGRPPKKVKANATSDNAATATADNGAGGERTRATRSRSASAGGFTALNGNHSRVAARAEGAANKAAGMGAIKEEGEVSS